MKIRHSPRVDADLQVAFAAQSCRSVAASQMADRCAEDGGQACAALWNKTADICDRLATMIYPEMRDAAASFVEALDQMIEYEMYKATELYVLFAKEARHEGFAEIAAAFEEAAGAAELRWHALEGLREKIAGACVAQALGEGL